MNSFAITIWRMFGKVNVPIVWQEFNVVMLILKNKINAEIQRSKRRKEKLLSKLLRINNAIYKSLWRGEWIYLQEISFFTVFLKLIS